MPDFSTDLSSFLRDLQLNDEDVDALRYFGDQMVFQNIPEGQSIMLLRACRKLSTADFNRYIELISQNVDISTDPLEQERNEDSDDVICG